MNAWARAGVILATGLAVMAVALWALGFGWTDLRHWGEPRNVFVEGSSEYRVPLPEGPAERLAPALDAVSDGPYAFMFPGDVDSGPIRYDPCRPVAYVISPDGMPPRGQEIVVDAVARIEAATGLVFEYEGYTDEPASFDRELIQPDVYGDRFAPVIIGWSTEAQNPDLLGTVTGIGGSSAVSGAYGDQQWLRAGVVIMDAEDVGTLSATSAGEAIATAVVMHELAHVVGLAHVNDQSELLHPSNRWLTDWGNGDLAGLAIMGSGPCEEV